MAPIQRVAVALERVDYANMKLERTNAGPSNVANYMYPRSEKPEYKP